ncbi:TetR/AcrR family transcriptional regulator [Phocaeicola sartorii]|uniref:TetR/AcrR family transcriptional regulator n=1 Tax=Phocaeicola sartorii TaxID=671267 RepID=UPI00258FA686|nr:TetR/AcrR family transcriptional regulator [Phocaeicola sartorii]
MAETDWFDKPVENSRELILKEAFKLFLQKNVEKVTVPELERVTKLQRGAIFYHFKDKSAIFEEVIERYFFSSLNIFYPVNPDNICSLKLYWELKNEHIDKIQNWFKQEGVSVDPYTAFFHAAEQVRLYFPHFKERIVKMINASRTYWCQVAPKDVSLLKSKTNSFIFWGE